ncbi:MAG: response regulator, partial [Alistipes sp.]|nr:response regulator [Alistipes sp.]
MKKNVLIIEDETAAAVNLQAILRKVAPTFNVLTVLESIEESVEYFEDETSPQPDLVFMDIHLADGESFRIFDKIDITAPIIFTTAYDEYALRAFKVNSIDYILKPINAEELGRAIEKFERLGSGERSEYRSRLNTMVASTKR